MFCNRKNVRLKTFTKIKISRSKKFINNVRVMCFFPSLFDTLSYHFYSTTNIINLLENADVLHHNSFTQHSNVLLCLVTKLKTCFHIYQKCFSNMPPHEPLICCAFDICLSQKSIFFIYLILGVLKT